MVKIEVWSKKSILLFLTTSTKNMLLFKTDLFTCLNCFVLRHWIFLSSGGLSYAKLQNIGFLIPSTIFQSQPKWEPRWLLSTPPNLTCFSLVKVPLVHSVNVNPNILFKKTLTKFDKPFLAMFSHNTFLCNIFRYIILFNNFWQKWKVKCFYFFQFICSLRDCKKFLFSTNCLI